MRSNAPRNLSSKNPELKEYYFNVAGTVFFVVDAEPEEPRSIAVNAIMKNSTGQITESMLARAQQGLCQGCADKLGPTVQITIHDVQILAISKLGHMTPSEFHDISGKPGKEEEEEDCAPAKVE